MQARELAFAEYERSMAERQRECARQEQVLRESIEHEHRRAALTFADGLVQDGALKENQKHAIVELMVHLSAQPAIEFGEAEDRATTSAAQLLRDVLTSRFPVL